MVDICSGGIAAGFRMPERKEFFKLLKGNGFRSSRLRGENGI